MPDWASGRQLETHFWLFSLECRWPMSLRSSEGRKLPSLEVLDRLAGALEFSVLEVLDGVTPYDQVNAPRRRPRKAR